MFREEKKDIHITFDKPLQSVENRDEILEILLEK